MIALILLFSLLSGLLTKAPSLTSTEDQRGLLSVGSLAGVFSALAGIMLVTERVPPRHDPADVPLHARAARA